LLCGFVVLPAHAAFTSLYVFGDALSTTTNNQTGGPNYYGKRFCNGRVWVEVLAQRQGIGISNNWSYFDCNSANLVTNANKFTITQANATNALFVIWCNNSDLFDAVVSAPNTNQSTWIPIINRGQTNQFRAITNLYAKGVYTILMPNVVDISKVPYFCNPLNGYSTILGFIRQECIAYNVAFSNTLNQARAACPGLTIYQPNFFGLLDNVLSNAANYGLTNVLSHGVPIDAMDFLSNFNTNGPGTNYVFWDYLDPSAKFHEVIADVVQQIVSPVQIGGLTQINGSNRLDVVNMPMGLNGFLDGSTNLASAWTQVTNFNSIATTQSIFVLTPPLPDGFGSGLGGSGGSGGSGGPPAPGTGGSDTNSILTFNTAAQLYRLRFPYAWSWP
jgi:phospholipase/lecithinase/hemolysin